ncbi:MAG TPA: hypothetical protein VEA80_04075 [Vitreimonas sp.]|uniref:hypothetical protein n=1 Tax=Vitreimonas sp. TaxID=3069702 RepID=UPI002D231A10|nr:hypothetical protein [Vitreimonas sp.]HYD86628.1 hypothetical protein [Vitreimonas sp.]
MSRPLNLLRSVIAPLTAAVTLAAVEPAKACSLPAYEDDGRYVGGDLITQIARKADTIQIVRVTARHLVWRTYTEGEWYLRNGDTNVPDHEPEYVDQFVYALSVVETLKGATDTASFLYEQNPRILAYGATELFQAYGRQADAVASHPNRLPDWLPERPGDNGTAFTGGATQEAGLGLGECNGPYFVDVGQTFIALRDNIGRLYPSSGGFPLTIDAEFRSRGLRERVSFNMQSLIPIRDNTDPLLTRLREALAQHR